MSMEDDSTVAGSSSMTTIPTASRKPVAMLFLFVGGMFFMIRGLIWEGLGRLGEVGPGIFLLSIGAAFIVGGVVIWRKW